MTNRNEAVISMIDKAEALKFMPDLGGFPRSTLYQLYLGHHATLL